MQSQAFRPSVRPVEVTSAQAAGRLARARRTHPPRSAGARPPKPALAVAAPGLPNISQACELEKTREKVLGFGAGQGRGRTGAGFRARGRGR